MDINHYNTIFPFHLNFNTICVIIGDNENPKDKLFDILDKGFNGELGKDFTINNIPICKNEYEVIHIDDSDDFESEFKFLKSNTYKNKVYEKAISPMLEEGITNTINTLNEQMEVVNTTLNKHFGNQIQFKTQLSSLNELINSNTLIQVKENNLKTCSKYEKRMMFFELLKLYLSIKSDIKTILLIEDIDAYMSITSQIYLYQFLTSITSENLTIIISGSTPYLFQLFESHKCCFKIKGAHLYKLHSVEKIMFNILNEDLKRQSDKNTMDNYTPYIDKKEIQFYLNKYYYQNLNKVGVLFSSDTVTIGENLNKITLSPLISYQENFEKEFFLAICSELHIDIMINP